MNDTTRPWPYDGMEGRARLTGNACYPSVALGEAKTTDLVHVGCGGSVLVSLDGEFCGRCGDELREEDWVHGDSPAVDSESLPGSAMKPGALIAGILMLLLLAVTGYFVAFASQPSGSSGTGACYTGGPGWVFHYNCPEG